ncbi:MAG: agmatine deiminase family protein [Acidimicrobiia bacterium]|nr:agmatine deiminase family protein [Acidimicrobiia bacterium]
MPAEWEPHERTLMAWPVHHSWGAHLDRARQAYADLANAIIDFEPLTMLVNPGEGAGAHRLLSSRIDLVEIPYESAWQRDSGPLVVVDDQGSRRGIDFRFNAWGERFLPYQQTAEAAGAILSHLGIERVASSMVLEGGSITVDGEGTLITTEQCLLNPNRNRDMTRGDIERELGEKLGIEKVIWLPVGIAADFATDGHVDAVCTFAAPGAVLLQGCTDPHDPDFERMAANRAALDTQTDSSGRSLQVIELPDLPGEPFKGADIGVAYANLVIVNGAVIGGIGGYPTDDEALEIIGTAFPQRAVVGVDARIISYAGGGPHCTTMQIPAGGSTT